MYLIFDTETTGVPKNYKAPMADLDNWPRVIQLAWAMYDENHQLVDSRCDLIKPNGWVIPQEKFWIDNGFSQYQSLKEGIDINVAISFFIDALEKNHYLIAHNMKFDHNIVGAEMIRLGASTGYKIRKICTMESTTELVGIRNNYGGYKWPKLEELHTFLFRCNFEGAHDAGYDVAATAKCFFELIKRKVIILNQ